MLDMRLESVGFHEKLKPRIILCSAPQKELNLPSGRIRIILLFSSCVNMSQSEIFN